jgi:hypothetical protein
MTIIRAISLILFPLALAPPPEEHDEIDEDDDDDAPHDQEIPTYKVLSLHEGWNYWWRGRRTKYETNQKDENPI